MRKSFLFAQHRFVFVLFLLSVVLGGCIIPFTPPQPVCPPAEANIYRGEPEWWTSVIFDYAHPSTPVAPPTNTPDPANTTPVPTSTPLPANTPIPDDVMQQQIKNARYAAFQYLIEETKRWSKVETIRFNDSSEAEVVITFVSPSLLQAVFLNNTLRDSIIASDFHSELRGVLDSVAAREELLFIMTVTSPSNNTTLSNHIIKLPIDKVTLNNAAKIELSPNHSDFNLGQPINTTSEAVFGYIGFPLAKKFDDGRCVWALDQKYTEIVLSLPDMEVDGSVSGQRSWTIPYTPLLNSTTSPEPPNFNIPEGYNQNDMTPSSSPPSGIKSGNRWQDFARFIWSKTTLR